MAINKPKTSLNLLTFYLQKTITRSSMPKLLTYVEATFARLLLPNIDINKS